MKISKSLSPFLLILLLSGCGKPSAPSNRETLDFLNSQQPASSPFQATSVTLETFPQGDGQCRVKFKATYETKVDLLESVSQEEAFRSVGWEANTYQQALNAVNNMTKQIQTIALSLAIPMGEKMRGTTRMMAVFGRAILHAPMPRMAP